MLELTDEQVVLLHRVYEESERSPDNMAEISALYEDKRQSPHVYALLRGLESQRLVQELQRRVVDDPHGNLRQFWFLTRRGQHVLADALEARLGA